MYKCKNVKPMMVAARAPEHVLDTSIYFRDDQVSLGDTNPTLILSDGSQFKFKDVTPT